MKKLLCVGVSIFVGLVLGFGILFVNAEEPELYENGEEIDLTEYSYQPENVKDFNISININQDSSINVEEKINYNFGSQQRHGIYRNIPYRYKARGGNFNLRFSDINVVDENGSPYKYEVLNQGSDKNIKIGDANAYVTGVHTYVISYKIERALNYFESHDELYWNVTGNEWEVPIEKSQAKISLPESVDRSQLQMKCFTGVLGSTTEDCTKEVIDDRSVLFKANEELNYYEGLTVVFGWPKGIVVEPDFNQKLLWILQDNWYLGLPIIVFIFSFIYWRIRGKDPKQRETIIAEYEPPDNLTPAEVGTVYDNKADTKDVTATLIDLAIRGYLKIKQTGTGSKDYKFLKLKEPGDLNSYEKDLMESVFGSSRETRLNDLKNTFYTDLSRIKKNIYDTVVIKKYYAKNPSRAKFGCLFVFSIMLFMASFPLGFVSLNFFLGVSLLVSAIIMFVFSMFMSKRTVKGVRTLEKILGFKEFLKVTEKERLKFHNPPEMVPELFEKFLPYAMALGVETEWAKNFEDIYKQQPNWYESHTPGVFTPMLLANSLSSFSAGASSVMVSQPASTASGSGSGFSGGGSGGGFGGGGGGSW